MRLIANRSRERAASLGISLLVAFTAACTPPSAAPSQSGEASPIAETSSPSPSPTTFVVPAPTDPPLVRKTLVNSSLSHPALETELQSVFELIYQARSLRPGGQFDAATLRGLVEGAYADYTLPLFDQEISDAQSGRLLEVSFSGIAVSLDSWTPFGGPGGNEGPAQITVTRTRREVRAGSAPTSETATYKFRAERWGQRSRMFGGVGADPSNPPDAVHWSVYDFVNPATERWITEPPPITTTQAASELSKFFVDFYADRSVAPGQPFNIIPSSVRAAGSYRAYTMPLLTQTEREVASGAVKEIRYADISVKLLSWDEKATEHGGLALAEVTRTAYVTRASGAEPPQTATYRFRVHRHDGTFWLVVDFFRPDVGRWVTEIAGATVIVPESGHG
jgi:hypothetical protein